jgi:hypothetical protein
VEHTVILLHMIGGGDDSPESQARCFPRLLQEIFAIYIPLPITEAQLNSINQAIGIFHSTPSRPVSSTPVLTPRPSARYSVTLQMDDKVLYMRGDILNIGF